MKWNVVSTAFQMVNREPPQQVLEVEAIITRVLSEADMESRATAESVKENIEKALIDRVILDDFKIEIENNAWGFWPRPLNLYSWISLCGFGAPEGIAEEGDYDWDFLVLSYHHQFRESLRMDMNTLRGHEIDQLSQAKGNTGKLIPVYSYDNGNLSLDQMGMMTLDALLQQVKSYPEQALAIPFSSLEEAESLSALLRKRVKQKDIHIIVIEDLAATHLHLVVCTGASSIDTSSINPTLCH